MATEEPDVLIHTRVPQKIKAILKDVCERRGESEADFFRRSVLKELADLGFLTNEDKKALGLKVSQRGDNE